MKEGYLKAIGKLLATENAIRSVTSIVLRLMIGFFAGLPPEAISFNASVAFLFTIIFEFPTGLIADYFGYAKCISIGCYLQASAVFVILLSILAFRHGDNSFMWLLLAVEGVVDALGNALISGAKEALLQNTVESHTKSMNAEKARLFRSSYLSMAEAYSRWVPVLSSALIVLLVVLLEKVFGNGIWLLPLLSLGWIYLERVYRNIYLLSRPSENKVKLKLGTYRESLSELVRAMGNSFSNNFVLYILICLSLFYNYFIQINLTISILRGHYFFADGNVLLETLLITGLILSGKILRSYLLPIISKLLSVKNVLFIGALFAMAWGSCFNWDPFAGVFGQKLFFAILILFSEMMIGLLVRPSQMMVLEAIPSHIRATFMSFVSATVFFLHMALALIFTFLGTGVPSRFQLSLIAITNTGIILIFISWKVFFDKSTKAI